MANNYQEISTEVITYDESDYDGRHFMCLGCNKYINQGEKALKEISSYYGRLHTSLWHQKCWDDAEPVEDDAF